MHKKTALPLRILSLNIEGTKHYQRVLDVITQKSPDVLCLQEVPKEFTTSLENLGFFTTYLPRCIKSQDNGNTFQDGIVIGTKVSHRANTHNYFTISSPDDVYDTTLGRRRNNHGVIVASFIHDEQEYTIANTHFTWAADGTNASKAQQTDLASLLTYTQTLPPHILCGDLNIPRAYNSLYAQLIRQYVDAIPHSYSTSLDKIFHRMRFSKEQETLLNTFMVDYILTTESYTAKDVQQIFGISDHCATVADIHRT